MVENGHSMCQVLNPTAKSIRIPQGKILAISYPVNTCDIIDLKGPPSVSMASETYQACTEEDALRNANDLGIDLSDTALNKDQQRKLKILIVLQGNSLFLVLLRT